MTMGYAGLNQQGIAAQQQDAFNRMPLNVPEAPKVAALYQVITASSEALRDCHRVIDRLRESLVGPEPQQTGSAQPQPGPRSIHEAAKEMGELLGALQKRLHEFESQL